MNVTIALTDFNILRPSFEVNQAETLELLSQAHAKMAQVMGEENYTYELLKKMFNRFGLKPEQVSKRGLESHEMSFNVRSILERTRFFSEKANAVLERFYPESAETPGHLIHVTCTGYVSPSPAQFLIQNRGWSEETKVTHAYHMGCYASIPSIRIAQGFLQNEDVKVDLVHTEMCSLHLNPAIHSPEQIVVQSLFADGYIKYSAVPANTVNKGIKLITTLEKIIPNSVDDMSWITADWGMHMTLSRDVPEKIAGELMNFIKKLCQSLIV